MNAYSNWVNSFRSGQVSFRSVRFTLWTNLCGHVTSVGWQVTLRDPVWHVSSRSGVATQPAATLLTWRYVACCTYREVFDGQCAELVHKSQTASHRVELLRREVVQKDDVTARLRADVIAAGQAVQQLEKQCSRIQSQLDSELETKDQLQRR